MIYILWFVGVAVALLLISPILGLLTCFKFLARVFLKNLSWWLTFAFLIWLYNHNYQKVKEDPGNPSWYGTIYRITVPECNEYWKTHTLQENYREYGSL